MVKQPLNKQVKQRKETSATARRRFPPAPRLPDTRTTPATYMACSEAGSAAYLADPGCGKSDESGLQNSARGVARKSRRSPAPLLALRDLLAERGVAPLVLDSCLLWRLAVVVHYVTEEGLWTVLRGDLGRLEPRMELAPE